MIDSDKRDSRTSWAGKRFFSVNNKVEEIRILCECVGGSILEAIPNTFPVKGKCFVVQPACIIVDWNVWESKVGHDRAYQFKFDSKWRTNVSLACLKGLLTRTSRHLRETKGRKVATITNSLRSRLWRLIKRRKKLRFTSKVMVTRQMSGVITMRRMLLLSGLKRSVCSR